MSDLEYRDPDLASDEERADAEGEAPALPAGKRPRTARLPRGPERQPIPSQRRGLARVPELARILGVEVNCVEAGRPLAEVAHAEAGGKLRFRDTDPAPAVVAEEVIHLAQMQIGVGAAQVSSPDDTAEREAAGLAAKYVAGGGLGQPQQTASASLMLFSDPEIERALVNLRALAASAVPAMADAMDGSWGDSWWNSEVDPQRVRGHVSTFFGQVRTMIRNTLTEPSPEVTDWLLDRSRELLQRAYFDVCGRTLQGDVQTHVHRPYRADILGWITVQGLPRPAATVVGGTTTATATGGPAAAVPAAPAPVVSVSTIDPELLRQTISDLATAAVTRLRTETEASVYSEDSQILAFIREYRRSVGAALADHHVTDPRALDEAMGVLRTTYAQVTTRPLATDLRNCMALDDEATALRLIGAAGGDTAAVRTTATVAGTPPAAGDPAAVAAELRGRTDVLHIAIERMISASGTDKRSHIGAVDAAHDALLQRAQTRGLEGGAAMTAVEDAYRLETGHVLVERLRMAVRGDEETRTAIENRLGYGGRLTAATSGSDAAMAEARQAYDRVARTMYAHVAELRNSDFGDFLVVSSIVETFDRLDAEGRPRGLTSRDEQLTLFETAYHDVNGVPFHAHLRQSCDGPTQVAELERRLHISLSGTETVAPRGAAVLDLCLQELHDVFEESYVEDQQVVDACTAARAAANSMRLTLDGMRQRYEDRFHVGLAGQIRARVSDAALRRTALQACGVVEDRTAELVAALPSGGNRDAMASFIEAAGAAARGIYAGRRSGATVNQHARAYRDARPPGVDAARAWQLLEQQYSAQGGDLLMDLYNVRSDARDALYALDIAGGVYEIEQRVGRRLLASDGAAAPADDTPAGRYTAAVRGRIPLVYSLVEGADVAGHGDLSPGAPRPAAGEAPRDPWLENFVSAWNAALAWSGEPDDAERRRILMTVYRQTYGLSVEPHLHTQLTMLSEVREALAVRLGFTIERAPATRRPEDVTIDSAAVLRDEHGTVFNLEQAQAAARELAFGASNLHRLTQIMGGGGRGRTDEERRVIREVHDATNPAMPLALRLQRAYGRTPGVLRQARSLCGITADLDLRGRLLSRASSADFTGVRELLLGASADDLATWRDDGELMAAFRNFGTERFEDLREVLRGHESLDELTTAEGGLFDAGRVMEDLRVSARAQSRVFDAEVRRESSDLTDDQVRDRVRVRMRAWVAAREADPTAVSALMDTFDHWYQQADTEALEEASMTAVTETGELELIDELIRDPDRASLIDDLRSLSDTQRTRLRGDSEFISRLRRSVAPDRVAQAMAVLEGRHLDMVIAGAADNELGTVLSEGAELDETGRRALAARSGEVREGLSRGRTAFDRMVDEMNELDRITDPRERRGRELAFQHAWRIIGAVAGPGSETVRNGRVLQRALDAHNETAEEFTQPMRQRCEETAWNRVSGLTTVAGSGETMNIMRSLILRLPGAIDAMTAWSLRNTNDVATLTHALDTAPPDHVLREWSNVIKPGVHGEQFSTVVSAWVGQNPRDQNSPEYLAFRQFRLDVSGDLHQVLLDEWDLGGTYDAEMVQWTNQVRARIRAIDNDSLAAVLHVTVPTLDAETAGHLNDEARRQATAHLETMDSAALDLDEGWLARAFTMADERSEETEASLAQAYNNASADGTIDATELRALEHLRGDLDGALAEYRRAREEVSHYAEAVAGILVAAVGTALAGPAGAAVGIQMLIAGTGAVVSAAVREAVNGRNYEFIRTGLPGVVRQTLQAGIMAGCSQWVQRVGSSFVPSGPLTQSMTRYVETFAATRPVTWQILTIGRETVTGIANQSAQDMIERVAVETYLHGTNQGLLAAHDQTRAMLDGLGENFVTELVTNLLTVEGGPSDDAADQVRRARAGMGEGEGARPHAGDGEGGATGTRPRAGGSEGSPTDTRPRTGGTEGGGRSPDEPGPTETRPDGTPADEPARPRTPATPLPEARATELSTAFRGHLTEHLRRLGVTDPGEFQVHALSADEFRQRFETERGRAVFMLDDNGRPVIYAREDARPHDMLDEAAHLAQMRDPAMAARIEMLSEANLADWSELSAQDRILLMREKLAIEIDGRRRSLEMLQRETPPDDGAIMEAAESLRQMTAMETQLESITPDQLRAMNADPTLMPRYLDRPPRLFGMTTDEGRRVDRLASARELGRSEPLPRTGARRSAAYTSLDGVTAVRVLGEPWRERTLVTTDVGGTVIAVTADRITVRDREGNLHHELVEDGMSSRVRPGQEVRRGQTLAEESRDYRLVEIEIAGPPRRTERREEIRSLDDSGWVQRGSESTRRGAVAELAAQLQLDDELAEAVEEGDIAGFHRLPYRNGSGGFDDAVAVFEGSGDAITARIRIREVKHYPDRGVPLDDFTAITGTRLLANLDALRQRVNGAITARRRNRTAEIEGFGRMELGALLAIRDALNGRGVTIELVQGPTTRIGREDHPSSTVIDALRSEISSRLGYDALVVDDDGAPVTLSEREMAAAEALSGGTTR